MLRFVPSVSESDLRRAIIECGRICYERHLMTSNDGNVSVRLDDGRVLITAAGTCKGRLFPEDILTLDEGGRVLASRGPQQPSSETPMHLGVYAARSDVRGVIHAHPVFATALTVAGLDFPTDILPEVLLALGEVPVTDYATPSSPENAEVIGPLIGRCSASLLRQHGTLTVGVDLEESLQRLERVEHVAEVYWRARALGRVSRLGANAQRKLVASRKTNQSN